MNKTNWQNLTDATFDTVIASNDLVILDFWADWCQPCKGFTRVLEQVAIEYPNIIFGSVNIDTEKNLAEEFSISSVPTLMIFRQGVIVFFQSGVLPKSAITDLIQQACQLDMKTVQTQLDAK